MACHKEDEEEEEEERERAHLFSYWWRVAMAEEKSLSAQPWGLGM